MKLKIEDKNLVISREKIRQSKIIKRPLHNIPNLNQLIKTHNESFIRLQSIKQKVHPLNQIFYCKNCLHYNGGIYTHGINNRCHYDKCECTNFESLGFSIEIILSELGTNILDVLSYRFKNMKLHKPKDKTFWIYTEFRTKFRDYVKD